VAASGLEARNGSRGWWFSSSSGCTQLTFLGLTSWRVSSLFFTLKTPGRGHALEVDELKFDLRLSTISAFVSQGSYFIFLSLSFSIYKIGTIAPISECCNEDYVSE